MPAHAVSPVESVAEALDRWCAGERVEVLSSEFLDVLAAVPDPRNTRGRRYSLVALLAIAILATFRPIPGHLVDLDAIRTAALTWAQIEAAWIERGLP